MNRRVLVLSTAALLPLPALAAKPDTPPGTGSAGAPKAPGGSDHHNTTVVVTPPPDGTTIVVVPPRRRRRRRRGHVRHH